MRRQRIELSQIADWDNLQLATWRAARGKRGRKEVIEFLGSLDQSLVKLCDGILSHQVPRSPMREFTIFDPKQRTIAAVGFEDRVLHHAIMNVAEARLERSLVASSYACRPGKGVHRAATELQGQLRRHQWFVQFDIDSYFPSIQHSVLLELFARRFKGAEFLELMSRILSRGAPHAPGIGLPIGSLVSQHCANLYLDGADREMLGQLETRAHIRYMDDFVLCTNSKAAAQSILRHASTWLATERGLRVKPSARIARCRQGLLFCGYRIKPGVILPSARKARRYRAGRKRLQRAARFGLASEAAVQQASDILEATLAHTQATRLRRAVAKQLAER